MIHSIHRGVDLEKGFAIGDNDFSDVEYPGDLRDCSTCHVNNSQQLSGLPDGLLPTTTPQAWWSPMQPEAAACLSCHDSDDAAIHAYSNTSFFGESCTTCHGEGRVAAVDKVHAY
jgi:OmcA/MtrC family decaheme c-type cytochrome